PNRAASGSSASADAVETTSAKVASAPITHLLVFMSAFSTQLEGPPSRFPASVPFRDGGVNGLAVYSYCNGMAACVKATMQIGRSDGVRQLAGVPGGPGADRAARAPRAGDRSVSRSGGDS